MSFFDYCPNRPRPARSDESIKEINSRSMTNEQRNRKKNRHKLDDYMLAKEYGLSVDDLK